MSMNVSGGPGFLSLPYRDRQLVVIDPGADRPSEPVALRIGDYHNRSAWSEGLKEKAWMSRSWWTNTRNLGVAGYLYDRARLSTQTAGPGRGIPKYVVRLANDELHELRFPPGHPLYRTVYAGHPLRPATYLPVASFHRFLFEEKLNELLVLLRLLGALQVSVTYVVGYQQATSSTAGTSLNGDEGKSALSFKKFNAHAGVSQASLMATFRPQGPPRRPEQSTWLQFEPTWNQIADARLGSGLREIDVELRYDDDFGVGADLVAGLTRLGLRIGGDFTRYERTHWNFHADFEAVEPV